MCVWWNFNKEVNVFQTISLLSNVRFYLQHLIPEDWRSDINSTIWTMIMKDFSQISGGWMLGWRWWMKSYFNSFVLQKLHFLTTKLLCCINKLGNNRVLLFITSSHTKYWTIYYVKLLLWLLQKARDFYKKKISFFD